METRTRTPSSAFVAALDRDWDTIRRSPKALRTWESWTTAHSPLRDYELSEIPLELPLLSSDQSDRLLLTLLTLAHDGDALAPRIVLQAFRGRIHSLARTVRAVQGESLSDRHAQITSAAWEAILTYPLHRTSRVAANLAMGMLHAATPQTPHGQQFPVGDFCSDPYGLEDCMRYRYGIDVRSTPQPLLAPPEPMPDIPQDPVDQALTGDARPSHIQEILLWAQDHTRLGEPDISLIARYFLTEDPARERLVLAKELGITYPALRKRVHRALTILRTSITDHIRDCNA